MGKLSDAAALPPQKQSPVKMPKPPKGWEPGVDYSGEQAKIITPPMGELGDDPAGWKASLEEAMGLKLGPQVTLRLVRAKFDPAAWHRDAQGEDAVTRPVWRHEFAAEGMTSVALPDLQELWRSARASRMKAKERPDDVETATVVAWADPQTGKVASRGGTPELIERQQRYLDKALDYHYRAGNQGVVVADVGDIIEGFQNSGPDQRGTNDLSLMDQVDQAGTTLFEVIKAFALESDWVTLIGCGSNHCRWREKSLMLGKATDDWGVHILRQIWRRVQDQPERFGHIDVRWPQAHDETLAIEVAGQVLGLAHGHQAPNQYKVSEWWARQVHGGQPVHSATVLLNGHYHSFMVEPSGRDPVSGRDKWRIQAPTMDGGSDYYREKYGSDSDPALLVFTLTPDGWERPELLR